MSAQPVQTAKSTAMDLEWSDLSVLLAVCRTGSLSGAARNLGQNHSTIFRKINAIESKTGVRFFERLPGGYAMTDAGRTALRFAERIEAEVQALGREVLGQDMRLQGKIRVTAPEGMITEITPALFMQFCRLHPEVSIEVTGATVALDLVRREADVAIRATNNPPDASLGRKVCDFRFSIYASPEFIKQHKEIPLHEQPWCLITGVQEWLVPNIFKKKALAEQQLVFSSTNPLAVMNTAAAGIGLTALPCYLGDPNPNLVRVGNYLEYRTLELWVLTHPDLRHTARVKALIAFLHEELLKRKNLFEGVTGKKDSSKPAGKPGHKKAN